MINFIKANMFWIMLVWLLFLIGYFAYFLIFDFSLLAVFTSGALILLTGIEMKKNIAKRKK